MKHKYLILVLVSVVFNSCSTTLKIRDLNEYGKLPTEKTVSPSEIYIDKSINIDTSFHTLLIKDLNKIFEYDNYIIETIKRIGGFREIQTTEEMEQYIIANNLSNKVSNISDKIELSKLQKEIGNFLICETITEQTGTYEFRFHFRIINAANAEVILDINHYAFNWAGLDKPLFNPVFNYYIDWLKKNRS